MAKSESLFNLIKTMSQGEKRYFKVFCKGLQAGSKDQSYLVLFDLVNDMDAYDEGVIAERLTKADISGNLSSRKNYLYNLILKSLRNFHAGQVANVQLQEHLADIFILERKGLIRQALKRNRQAEKMATELGLDMDRLRIMDLRRRLIRQFIPKKSEPLLKELQLESKTLLGRIQTGMEVLDHYERIFAALQGGRGEQLTSLFSETIDFLQQHILREDLSPRSLLAYHFIFSYYYRMQKQYKEARFHYSELVQLFEQHPRMKREYQQQYIGVLSNYLNSCFVSREFSDVPEMMNRLEEIRPHNAATERTIQEHLFYSQLLFCVFRNDFAEAVRLAPGMKTFLTANQSHIGAERRLSFHYNIAWAFLMEGTRHLVGKAAFLPLYSKALEKTSFIISEPAFDIRPDIKVMIRLFAAIIHIELENLTVAEFFIRSASHLIKKKDKAAEAEKLVVRFLKQLLNSDHGHKKSILQEMAKQLEGREAVEKIQWWVYLRLG